MSVAKAYSLIIARASRAWQPVFLCLKSNVFSCVKLKIMPFFMRWNFHTALAIAGMIGPIMLAVSDLWAGLASPGYSIVQDSISSLALTGVGWIQTIGFLTLGLLIEIFTAGMLFNMKRAGGFHLGIAIFVFFGFTMLLIGAFRTDPASTADAARTVEGRIHGLTAQATFILFPVALLCLITSIKKDVSWQRLYRYTGISFMLGVVLIVVIRVMQEPNPAFGLMERLLVLNMILWVEIAAVNLFFISLKRKEQTKPVSAGANRES